MGYTRPVTVYRLEFEARDGLEVRVASVSIDRLMGLQKQAAELKQERTTSFDEARELFETFAESLRSWNLEEDDGTPVPATLAGVLSLELGFASELLLVWFEAIAGVPAPLDKRSTGGSPSEVPSIPMEALSPSLLS